MTAVHRGPVKGYNSREKQAYRKAVWASMAKAIEIANASGDSRPYYILLLPGLSTKEVDMAVRCGLKHDRIILVHESEEHVNTEAEWRTKYPNIKYYTGLLSDVLEQCKEEKIHFAGANLDFCGNFSSETIDQYSAFCDYYSKNQHDHVPLTVGVTVTKGRETPSMVRMLEKLHTRNSPVGLEEKRLEVLVREFGVEQKEEEVMYIRKTSSTISVLVEGSYVHHRAPMAYCVVEYTQPQAFIAQLLANCRKEAVVAFKQFAKVAPKKIPDVYKMKTKEEFVRYTEKRKEIVEVAKNLLSPTSRKGEKRTNLSQFYSLTDGHRTRVKTLSKRFLSAPELKHFEETLHGFGISCHTSLDFSLTKDHTHIPHHLAHIM